MAFIEPDELKDLYTDAETDANIWREDYPSYERLADNGLLENLDPNLPEVNDGSLAAALFKLPKRVVSSKLSGIVKALDRDEAWVSVLANIVWQKKIIPNANTQAPFHRKWKDAVRKSAIYGGVPIITLYINKEGDESHADFIVGQPQDVLLEAGKVSDTASDIKFWDIYYSKLQLKRIIEQAEAEVKQSKVDPASTYNKWDIPELKRILKSKAGDSERPSNRSPKAQNDNGAKPKGFHFCIAVQDGVGVPFYMYYKDTNKVVREWSNPDPTGDTIIHYLYCYQDMINPYGVGIVKLAGGTQNVLDYMRQADVLATQIGLRPPRLIKGDADEVDFESMVYAQDADWIIGDAVVERLEISNSVYQQLPARMQMYQTSLQKLIPTGDTSISGSDSGDAQYSKTPAGVKLAAANLSIDDEDFKDNLYITYAQVAKSMINTHFANMEGKDIIKVSDDERDQLIKAGLEWPVGEDGEMSNEFEIIWDDVRATFDFEVDPEQDKATDDQTKLDGLTKVAELIAQDPTVEQDLAMNNKKLNKGELYAEIISLTTDNDKIVTDIGPEEEQDENIDPETGQPIAKETPEDQALRMNNEKHQADMFAKEQQLKMQADKHDQTMAQTVAKAQMQMEAGQQAPVGGIDPEEMQANVDAVMEQYGVDENTALAALAAEASGLPKEEVIAALENGVRV